jgi:hypothetical protein
VQIPLLDPMALVPAMAYATTHLGFGVTCNLAYEAPFLFARRVATLSGRSSSVRRVAVFDGLPALQDRLDQLGAEKGEVDEAPDIATGDPVALGQFPVQHRNGTPAQLVLTL